MGAGEHSTRPRSSMASAQPHKTSSIKRYLRTLDLKAVGRKTDKNNPLEFRLQVPCNHANSLAQTVPLAWQIKYLVSLEVKKNQLSKLVQSKQNLTLSL